MLTCERGRSGRHLSSEDKDGSDEELERIHMMFRNENPIFDVLPNEVLMFCGSGGP
jgi:hypothetical protein